MKNAVVSAGTVQARRRYWRKTLAASAALVALLGISATPALADEAISVKSPEASQRPDGAYCMTIVHRVNDQTGESVPVSSECSDSAITGTVIPDTASSRAYLAGNPALLVTFFAHQSYGGNWRTVGGDDGPCDSAGYGLSNLIQDNFYLGISSYKLSSNCRRSTVYTETNYGGYAKSFSTVNVPYVGTTHNDQVFSMRVKA